MILFGLWALVVTGGVTLGVWAATNDLWSTLQAGCGAAVGFFCLGVALEALGRFREDAPRPNHDTIQLLDGPSAAWLIPGLSLGDGSRRYLQSRTLPALRVLAGQLVGTVESGLDDSDRTAALTARVSPRTAALLAPDGHRHLGHGRRGALEDIAAIIDDLETL